MTERRLAEKVALVTGSSRAIGRAIVVRFAREGADVAINYSRDESSARDVLAEVEASGRRGVLIKADLANVSETRAMVDEVVSRLGRLDVLVNNAGIEKKAPFWEATEKDYDQVMGVNLKGTFFASQAMVQHLRHTKRPGRIINISSVHEELPFPGFASYCASKGGVRMLTRNLAVELGPLGITVNAIAPGAIAADQRRPAQQPGATRRLDWTGSSWPARQAGRRRRPGRIPGVARRELRHRRHVFRGRRTDVALRGAVMELEGAICQALSREGGSMTSLKQVQYGVTGLGRMGGNLARQALERRMRVVVLCAAAPLPSSLMREAQSRREPLRRCVMVSAAIPWRRRAG